MNDSTGVVRVLMLEIAETFVRLLISTYEPLAFKSGMSRTELYSLWERRNAELRRIGVKLVSLPEEDL